MALSRLFILLGFFVVLLSSLPRQIEANPQSSALLNPGVVIEKVDANSAAEKAGFQAGDVVLSWNRAGAKGQIASPFDLAQIEIEQGPLGNVTLEGLRGAEGRNWTVGSGSWGLKVRPDFSGKISQLYQEGLDLSAAQKFADAAARWRTAANDPESRQIGRLGPWLLLQAAEIEAGQELFNVADDAYQQAIQMATPSDSLVMDQVFRSWGDSFQKRRDWSNAERCYQRAAEEARKSSPENLTVALNFYNLGLVEYNRNELVKAQDYWNRTLQIQRKLAPESLVAARSLSNLGLVAGRMGDLAKAEEYGLEALQIRQKLVPGSLDVAHSINNLGVIAMNRGQFAKAEQYYQQSLDIKLQLEPGALDVAMSFDNLANVADSVGDPDKAESYMERSLEIKKRIAAGTRDLALTLTNLGTLVWSRGDVVKAGEYYSGAIEIEKKVDPGSLEFAASLSGMANVVSAQGDLAKAEDFMRQALDIQHRIAPDGPDEALTLTNLGEIYRQRGDFAQAEDTLRRSLKIRKKLAPRSLDVGSTLLELGVVSESRGDRLKAEEQYRQALDIVKKAAPASLTVATILGDLGGAALDEKALAKAEKYFIAALAITQRLGPEGSDMAYDLQNLGEIAHSRHDLPEAEQYIRHALKIRERLEPASVDHAESLASLASILFDRRQWDAASGLLQQSLDALESHTRHLGGSEEIRSEFRARHSDFYKNYIDLLLRQKLTDEAFYVDERLRAQSLLETLSAAQVDIHQGADPELLQAERALQASLNLKRDRRVMLLTAGNAAEQVKTVEREIEGLRTEYEQVEARLRTRSPAYAALTQPQPLTAHEVQKLLDEDTLLLEYSLSKERSYVWTLTPTSLVAHPLPPRKVVEAASRRLYKEISRLSPAGGRGKGEPAGKQVQSRAASAAAELSRMILSPVAQQIRGKRLLIVADGALQYVPFAILPEPGKPGGSPLVLQHEIVYSPSASVLAELRRQASGRAPAPKAVVVLADPVFDSDDPRVGNVADMRSGKTAETPPLFTQYLSRSAQDVGLSHLSRLPYSRREADAIVKLMPSGVALEALGFDASRATAISPDLAQYRVIHFATHGLSDNQHPELSGLVLSLVDREGRAQNGFLDLQDIYNLRLPAELVVLSACDTALGKEVQGEGLVGLTRGFMYAGATRVMASLWNADDASTKELMEKFYRAMEQDGMRPVAALRNAQVALLRQRRWKDPYYWAAFQIQGDWK